MATKFDAMPANTYHWEGFAANLYNDWEAHVADQETDMANEEQHGRDGSEWASLADFHIHRAKLRTAEKFPALKHAIRNTAIQNDTMVSQTMPEGVADDFVQSGTPDFESISDDEQIATVAQRAMMAEESLVLSGYLGQIATRAMANARIVMAGLPLGPDEVDIPQSATDQGAQYIHDILEKAYRYVAAGPRPRPQQGFFDEPTGNVLDNGPTEFKTYQEVQLACYGDYQLWDKLIEWVRFREIEETQQLQKEQAELERTGKTKEDETEHLMYKFSA